MASTYANVLPFYDLDDESFLLPIYEFQNGPIVYDEDRLSTLFFNPLLLNNKHHLALNNHLDPDDNLLDDLNNTPCEYYLEDQFNVMFRNECKSANPTFSTLHLNIRSILQNSSRFTDWLSGLGIKFSVIGITETWLKEADHTVEIHGYNFIHKHRENRTGGGVGLYLSNDLQFKSRNDLHFSDSNSIDALFIEVINSQGKNAIVGVVYRPPDQNLNTFVHEFNSLAEKISRENKSCFILGDFNINFMNYQRHNKTGEFVDSIFSNMLYPRITRPTRITSHTATLIDNILSNHFDCHIKNGLFFSDISDHLPIFSIIFENNNLTKNDIITFRDINSRNIQKFKENLLSVNWTLIEDSSDPVQAYTEFHDTYSNIYNNCFPLRTVKSNSKICKPWISKGLRKSINKKNKLYKQFLQNRITENRYKIYKNKLTHSIRIAKRIYYDKKLTDNKANMKETWKILNSIINRKSSRPRLNAVFKRDGREISNPIEIANNFCDYFSNVGPSLAKKIQASPVPTESFLSGEFPNSIFLEPVLENEIRLIAKAFPSGKAAGYDNISMSVIKLSIDLISRPLTHILNLSLSRGIVPDKMKIAKVIPLYKAEDKSIFSNYRPVSILPAFSKILEKVFYNRLLKYLNKHDILCANQYGFRKGHSTSLALVDLYDKISEAIDKKEFAVGIFLDLSKAFDTVDHSILFAKLEWYGVRGIALNWIKNYFSDRKQFVQVDDSSSTMKSTTCGVPQGSILGPLLFLIYINDICNVSSLAKLILFADDTNLFFSHANPVHLINVINQELEKISIWLRVNKLFLNVDKTKFMIFSPRQKRLQSDFRVVLNDRELSQVEEVVFLGVVLDEHLSWKSHINHVSNKISKSIGIMRKSSFFLLKHSLLTLYYSMVYPYLQYCNIVWASTYLSNLSRLVILQKRVVRIINNSRFDSPTGLIFKNFQLLKFNDIHKLQTGQFMFSYEHNLLPEHFRSMFCSNKQVHNYDTRRANEFHIITPRTNIRQFSIKYQGPFFYNSLNKNIVNSESLSCFAKKLKTHFCSLYIN